MRKQDKDMATLVAEVAAAYVANHKVEPSALPELIRQIRASLSSGQDGLAPTSGENALQPAVSIAESITPDYLICLEDGKPMKMLKRHLRSHYRLSPAEYREKWGLPADYPMTAPNYAKRRSGIAKGQGFGSSIVPKITSGKTNQNPELALTTLRSIGDAVVCTDIQCAITFMNPVAERLSGWDAVQAKGKCFIEVFKLQERASKANIYPARRCIEQATPFIVEVGSVLLNKSGEELDVGFSAAPIRTLTGEIVGSVMILNDLTKALSAGPN